MHGKNVHLVSEWHVNPNKCAGPPRHCKINGRIPHPLSRLARKDALYWIFKLIFHRQLDHQDICVETSWCVVPGRVKEDSTGKANHGIWEGAWTAVNRDRQLSNDSRQGGPPGRPWAGQSWAVGCLLGGHTDHNAVITSQGAEWRRVCSRHWLNRRWVMP